MTDHPTAETRFNEAPELEVKEFTAWVGDLRQWIYLNDSDGLDVGQARALRDWLNKVIPNE